MDERSLPVENIGRVLNCLQSIWQRTCGCAGLLSSTVKYRLILLESLRGYVHLVRKDFVVEVLSDLCPRIIEIQKVGEGEIV